MKTECEMCGADHDLDNDSLELVGYIYHCNAVGALEFVDDRGWAAAQSLDEANALQAKVKALRQKPRKRLYRITFKAEFVGEE